MQVSLCIKVGMVTDNLNRVLVCTNGTVRAKTPELAGSVPSLRCSGFSVRGSDRFCNIVVNADG